MKTKLLILSLLIISLICAFAFKGHSQTYVYGSKEGNVSKVIPADSTGKQLIADETWITQLKTGAKITSYSEKAFTDISMKFGNQFKRVSIVHKTDRHGPYKEYQIYLSQEVAENIRNWAKTNL
jgi:hypothetical protein